RDQHDHRLQGPDHLRHAGHRGQVQDLYPLSAVGSFAGQVASSFGRGDGPQLIVVAAQPRSGSTPACAALHARSGSGAGTTCRPAAGATCSGTRRLPSRGCPADAACRTGPARSGRMTRKSLGLKLSRTCRRTLAIGSGALLLAGCQMGGLNSLNMPGTAGHGAGSYSINIEVPDVATLPQNSPVMVDDVTVGSVSGVSAVQRPDGSFYAALRISLDGDVKLPANATARVAQTSLLGSLHVDLNPPVGEPPVGQLRDGSTIRLAQTGSYPTTEEVLSALGAVVNKGNLGALQDITNEAYAAVADRQGSFAGLIPRLAEFTASLDRQTNDIIATAEGLNRFAVVLAQHKDSLARTLDTLPKALQVLNDNRANIVDAFAALGKLARVASHVLT